MSLWFLCGCLYFVNIQYLQVFPVYPYAGVFFAVMPCYQDRVHSFSSTCELASDKHPVSYRFLAKDSVCSADFSMHYEGAL